MALTEGEKVLLVGSSGKVRSFSTIVKRKRIVEKGGEDLGAVSVYGNLNQEEWRTALCRYDSRISVMRLLESYLGDVDLGVMLTRR